MKLMIWERERLAQGGDQSITPFVNDSTFVNSIPFESGGAALGDLQGKCFWSCLQLSQPKCNFTARHTL